MDRHHFTEKDLQFFKEFYSNYQNAQEKDEIKVLARCPDPLGRHNNGDRNNSLALDLVQNGKGPTILMKCLSQECPTEEILAAKGLNFKDLYPTKNTTNPNSGLRGSKERRLEGVTLEAYAEYLRLPLDFLTGGEVGLEECSYPKYPSKDSAEKVPAVRIPYPNEEGQEVYCRYRVGLKKAAEGPDNRIRGKKGQRPIPYGLHGLEDARREGFILVCEGESDCHTFWFHGKPALGIPGARSWRDEWAHYLDYIDRILVCVEPDAAGEGLWEDISACNELEGRVAKVVFDNAL